MLASSFEMDDSGSVIPIVPHAASNPIEVPQRSDYRLMGDPLYVGSPLSSQASPASSAPRSTPPATSPHISGLALSSSPVSSKGSSQKVKRNRPIPREGPLICEACREVHDGTYGSGRFCSASCARRVAAHTKWERVKVVQSAHPAPGSSAPAGNGFPHSNLNFSISSPTLGPTSAPQPIRAPLAAESLDFAPSSVDSLIPPSTNIFAPSSLPSTFSFPPTFAASIALPKRTRPIPTRSPVSMESSPVPNGHSIYSSEPTSYESMSPPAVPDSRASPVDVVMNEHMFYDFSTPVPSVPYFQHPVNIPARPPSQVNQNQCDEVYHDVVNGYFKNMKRTDTESDLLRMVQEAESHNAQSMIVEERVATPDQDYLIPMFELSS